MTAPAARIARGSRSQPNASSEATPNCSRKTSRATSSRKLRASKGVTTVGRRPSSPVSRAARVSGSSSAPPPRPPPARGGEQEEERGGESGPPLPVGGGLGEGACP